MARYLSDDWFRSVATALTGCSGVDACVTIRQTATGGPDGDVTWTVAADGAGLRLTRDEAGDTVDVTFTQTYATAAAIASGQRSAQAAFMAGEIVLSGDAAALIAAAPAMAAVGDALAAVRASTTY